MEAVNFYLSDNIPTIFKLADQLSSSEEADTCTKIIPMPKKKKEKKKNKQKTPKANEKIFTEEKKVSIDDIKQEMIELLYLRDGYKDKLKHLNMNTKKGYRKSVEIIHILTNIEKDLKVLSEKYRVSIYTLERKTRLGRFTSKIKRNLFHHFKKIKKFCKKKLNVEFIAGITGVVLPAIWGMCFKKFVNP